MLRLLLIPLALAYCGYAKADTDPVKCSGKEVQNGIEFFTQKEIKLTIRIPVKSLMSYSFLSGRHLVRPRGNESMHAFWLKTEGMTTFFKFTVSPAISTRELEAADQKDLLFLLKDRKITQYRILELNEKVHRDLAIFAKGRVYKNPEKKATQ